MSSRHELQKHSGYLYVLENKYPPPAATLVDVCHPSGCAGDARHPHLHRLHLEDT